MLLLSRRIRRGSSSRSGENSGSSLAVRIEGWNSRLGRQSWRRSARRFIQRRRGRRRIRKSVQGSLRSEGIRPLGTGGFIYICRGNNSKRVRVRDGPSRKIRLIHIRLRKIIRIRQRTGKIVRLVGGNIIRHVGPEVAQDNRRAGVINNRSRSGGRNSRGLLRCFNLCRAGRFTKTRLPARINISAGRLRHRLRNSWQRFRYFAVNRRHPRRQRNPLAQICWMNHSRFRKTPRSSRGRNRSSRRNWIIKSVTEAAGARAGRINYAASQRQQTGKDDKRSFHGKKLLTYIFLRQTGSLNG